MKATRHQLSGRTLSRAARAFERRAPANDRLNSRFSLLQMARAHADQPDQPAVSLKRERRASG